MHVIGCLEVRKINMLVEALGKVIIILLHLYKQLLLRERVFSQYFHPLSIFNIWIIQLVWFIGVIFNCRNFQLHITMNTPIIIYLKYNLHDYKIKYKYFKTQCTDQLLFSIVYFNKTSLWFLLKRLERYNQYFQQPK